MDAIKEPSDKFEDLLGYQVYAERLDVFARDVESFILQRPAEEPCRIISCMNPHSYTVAKEDDTFRTSLEKSYWLIPDGVGAIYASRYNRGRIRRRITGSDAFHVLNKVADEKKLSVFLLGATEETLSDIEARFAKDYPRLVCAGKLAPPFKPNFSDADVAAMADQIRSAKPDILWVGLSAPKQEKWALKFLQHAEQCNVAVVGCIGAAFDFYTGRIKRTPWILRVLGLEWLPRLLQEPQRLWRRMFVSAPIFTRDVIAYKRFSKANTKGCL